MNLRRNPSMRAPHKNASVGGHGDAAERGRPSAAGMLSADSQMHALPTQSHDFRVGGHAPHVND